MYLVSPVIQVCFHTVANYFSKTMKNRANYKNCWEIFSFLLLLFSSGLFKIDNGKLTI